MRPLRLLSLLLCTMYYVLCTPPPVHSASLSVSLSVGLTYFVATGTTSPGAQLTLKEGNAIIATTTAAADGTFSLSTLDDDGLHTYSLYAVDVAGVASATSSYTVSLTPGSTTTLGNLVLPPTVTISSLDSPQGANIALHGYAAPSSTVLIFFANSQLSTVSTNTSGYWQNSLSTIGFAPGAYTLTTRNQLGSGSTSLDSLSATITLRPPAPTTPPPSAITSSPTPTPSPLPWWLAPFDSNSDNLLRLGELDFSLTRWLSSWRQALDSRRAGTCDLDHDRDCDLVDLSILLYYVNRQG